MKTLSSILSGAAIIPLMWWHVAPNAADYCGTTPYIVTQENPVTGESVTAEYRGDTRLCTMVKAFPRP